MVGNNNCKHCEGGINALSLTDIHNYLKQLEAWTVEDKAFMLTSTLATEIGIASVL